MTLFGPFVRLAKNLKRCDLTWHMCIPEHRLGRGCEEYTLNLNKCSEKNCVCKDLLTKDFLKNIYLAAVVLEYDRIFDLPCSVQVLLDNGLWDPGFPDQELNPDPLHSEQGVL